MKKYAIALVAAALTGVVVLSCVGSGAQATDVNVPAPALNIETWAKGSPVVLADGKGKNVFVVEFWATWCPPCRTTIPHLTKVQKKYKDQGLVVVGVSDEDAATVKGFVGQMGEKMDYTVAVDKNDQTNKDYMERFQVRGIPHAFVIDKSGAIVWHGHPMDGRLETALKKALAAKPSTDRRG